ncbi:hypothetical protein SK128_003721 [Halocaridina rubra]|uniref:lysoplasmalogenase n=1 Tax=Halocaridina rubra TaxID=373956 RepID=A0AAN8WIE1_HALRR
MKSKNSKTMSLPGKLPVHHLLPFVITAAAFLILFLPKQPTLQNVMLKCLPVLYLMCYLAYTEKGRGESKIVIPALAFSLIGDGLLNFPGTLFVEGLIAFSFAQVLYTATFGFKRINVWTGITLYGASGALLLFIIPNVNATLKIAVPVYALLIFTMLWRALDRYSYAEDICYERRLCSVLGAVVFIISDACIAFLQLMNLMPKYPAQIIILSTYFLAQLLLTLGAAKKFWDAKYRIKEKK